MEKLRWGIIGAGGIARTFAKGVAASRTGVLAGIGSRSLPKARAFAEALGPAAQDAKCIGSYEELLADPRIQAVYVAVPHPHHAEWSIKAAESGKHILCEKPLALNHAEAMAMVQA